MERKADTLPAQLHLEYSPLVSNTKRPAESPQYHGEAAVDIVAVHGLAATYDRTWSVEQPDGTRYHWLKEQLPRDIEDARVLGFEYASNWYDVPVHTSLLECGKQLLRCLVQDRSHHGRERSCPTRRKRPLILVGHSFGGLVIKQALVLAGHTPQSSSSPKALARYENCRELLSCVAGVIFLGTPHRGSGFSVFADIKMSWRGLTNFLGGTKPAPELVSILRVDSDMVTYLQKEFQILCEDNRLSNLSIYCFYEMKPLLFPPQLVVNEDSACIDNAYCSGMNANHMEMNKFTGADDPNYKSFLANLSAVFRQSSRTVSSRFESCQYGASKQDHSRDSLQRWLEPSRGPQTTQFTRKLDSYRSAPYTCQWLLNLEAFQRWRDAYQFENVLWITGKAGSGKSVLASYIIQLLRVGETTEKIVKCDVALSEYDCRYRPVCSSVLYFFCGVDRAHETPVRMLGTLIHQFLLVHCENEEIFQMVSQVYRSSQERFGESPGWEAMADLFLTMTAAIGNVFIIVDGMEENKSWKQCLKVLARLSTNTGIRIVTLSQATTDIMQEWPQVFPDSGQIVITDHSYQDIRQFSQVKTAELVSKKPALLPKASVIEHSVLSGSQGMFQWVNAALLQLEEDVEDPEQVEANFEGIPSELKSTWDRVFQRSAQKEDKQRDAGIRAALQLLAISGCPVAMVELKAVISLTNLGTRAFEHILDPDRSESLSELAEKEVPALLGSLIEVSNNTDTKTVQLAHPSLLAALTSSETPQSNMATARYAFSLDEAHCKIAVLSMLVCQRSTVTHANSFGPHKLPFVEYAWDYWAYHFHHATSSGEYHKSLGDGFNAMTFVVSKDVIAYLDALCTFLHRPLRAVPGRFSDREYVLSLQRAQNALLQPIANLTKLQKRFKGDKFSNRPPGIFAEVEEARKLLPDPAYQLPQATSIFSSLPNASKAINSTINSVVREKTTVNRIRLDEVLEKLTYLTQPTGSSKLMLDIARDLRSLTLRLAVDPVYSALILSAGGQSFSPIHLLIYTAQLFEQSGSFPYWAKLSPHSDLMESFCCPRNDPESAPANFVLHCFEWRERRSDSKQVSVAGRYVRTHRRPTVEPHSGGRQLLRVSTENEMQVRRLHKLPGKQYFRVALAYRVFKPKDEFFQLFTNPLAGWHMKKSLMLDEPNSFALMQDPDMILGLYAPQGVEDTPLVQFVAALPHMFRLYFVRWLLAMLEIFGRVSKQVLATHFARLQVAAFEFDSAIAFFRRFSAIDAEENLRYWYFIPGACIFWLRCRYVPTFGAYYMPHTWIQFLWAWRHPAAYLDLQNITGFWMWLGTAFRVAFYNGIGGMAIAWANMDMDNAPVRTLGNIYGIFHFLCTVERSIFGALTVIATLVSYALVIMKDPGSMQEMFQLSIFYWFNVFFGLFVSAIQTGALQNGAGMGAVLVASFFHIFMIIVFVKQYEQIVRWGSFLLIPVTAPTKFFWRILFSHYIFLAQLLGVSILLGAAGLAYYWTNKFIWDPYDVDITLQQLQRASRLARTNLQPTDYQYIGQAPFGDATALEQQARAEEQAAFRENAAASEMTEEQNTEKELTYREAAVVEVARNTFGNDGELAVRETIERERELRHTSEGKFDEDQDHATRLRDVLAARLQELQNQKQRVPLRNRERKDHVSRPLRVSGSIHPLMIDETTEKIKSN